LSSPNGKFSIYKIERAFSDNANPSRTKASKVPENDSSEKLNSTLLLSQLASIDLPNQVVEIKSLNANMSTPSNHV
jgi:hypothetical protein